MSSDVASRLTPRIWYGSTIRQDLRLNARTVAAQPATPSYRRDWDKDRDIIHPSTLRSHCGTTIHSPASLWYRIAVRLEQYAGVDHRTAIAAALPVPRVAQRSPSTGSITTIFVRIHDRYFAFSDTFTLPHRVCVARVLEKSLFAEPVGMRISSYHRARRRCHR